MADVWPDGWRKGALCGASMAGYLTLQSITDCLACIDGTDLLVSAGSGEGEEGGLRVAIFSATEGRVVQSYAGHTQHVVSVACDGATRTPQPERRRSKTAAPRDRESSFLKN